MAIVTSINIPLVGGTHHVKVVDPAAPIPALPPSGVTWTSAPNASGVVGVAADGTGFVFTGLAAGQWIFTATYNAGSNPHAALVVSVGPMPTTIGFDDT